MKMNDERSLLVTVVMGVVAFFVYVVFQFSSMERIATTQYADLRAEMIGILTQLQIAVSRLEDGQERLAESQKQLVDNQKQLADNQKQLAENQKRLETKVTRLEDGQEQLKVEVSSIKGNCAVCPASNAMLEGR